MHQLWLVWQHFSSARQYTCMQESHNSICLTRGAFRLASHLVALGLTSVASLWYTAAAVLHVHALFQLFMLVISPAAYYYLSSCILPSGVTPV